MDREIDSCVLCLLMPPRQSGEVEISHQSEEEWSESSPKPLALQYFSGGLLFYSNAKAANHLHFYFTYRCLHHFFWPANSSQWLCLLGIGACILVDRGLNIMIPFQTSQVLGMLNGLNSKYFLPNPLLNG